MNWLRDKPLTKPIQEKRGENYNVDPFGEPLTPGKRLHKLLSYLNSVALKLGIVRMYVCLLGRSVSPILVIANSRIEGLCEAKHPVDHFFINILGAQFPV